MREFVAEFKAFPPSVKNGFLFLVGGWFCNYLFFYSFFSTQTDEIPTKLLLQQAMLGFLCFYFLLKVRNWARVICLVGNIVIVVVYFFVMALLFGAKPYFSLLAGVTAALFSASTYFLFQKEASAYFKARNPQGDPAASGPDNNRSASS
jgi:peptidoglycan/LPS O-acetylase OafA/YrhL